MSFTHLRPGEKPTARLESLPFGRWRFYHYTAISHSSQITSGLTTPRGTLYKGVATTEANTEAFKDLRLTLADIASNDTGSYILRIYETLTTTLTRTEADKIDYDLNGLERITKAFIALPEADVSGFVVNTQEDPDNAGRFLASLKRETDDSTTKLLATYLQPGVVSKGRIPGEIAGTVRNTWQTFRVDPTDAAAMAAAGAGSPIPGVVIEDEDDNVQGYPTRRVVTISGTITGVKTTYATTADVRVPGTVELVTITTTSPAGEAVTIDHVPPRTKTIAATVTIEITTTPPTTAPTRAYDLGAISCALRSTIKSFAALGTDVFETADGGSRFSGAKYRLSFGSDIQTFPDCYLVGSTTATGTIAYPAGYENTSDDPNTIVTNELTSSTVTTLKGTGATSAVGYSTTGIIERLRPRLVLTTLAGVAYWEITTITAA